MRVKDGASLRRARNHARLTQVDLSKLVGCTQQYISMLEDPKSHATCSERIAERVCRYLDVHLDDYFDTRTLTPMPVVTTPSRVGSRRPS